MIERESESDRREDVFQYNASYLSKTRAHFVPLKPKLLDMARENVHPLRLVHELLYVCALSHGIIVHHEDGVDCLVDARGAEGVTALRDVAHSLVLGENPHPYISHVEPVGLY